MNYFLYNIVFCLYWQVVWWIVMSLATMAVLVRSQDPANPLLIFGHLLQGLDPAGPPKLFDDQDDDDDIQDDDYIDDEDFNPFSFLG